MKDKNWKGVHYGGSGAFYGLGLVGALIYYLQHSTTLLQALLGIVKAILWPAILTFRLFELLKL